MRVFVLRLFALYFFNFKMRYNGIFSRYYLIFYKFLNDTFVNLVKFSSFLIATVDPTLNSPTVLRIQASILVNFLLSAGSPNPMI